MSFAAAAVVLAAVAALQTAGMDEIKASTERSVHTIVDTLVC